jgi:hypothetical protein
MTWDIIDRVEPNVQITVSQKKAPRIGSVSSIVRIGVAFSVAFVASNSPKFMQHSEVTASAGAAMHWKKASHSIWSGSVVRGVVRDTDTQYGQSSSKLARVFPVFFQPAPQEPALDDDEYSFA